MARQRHSPYFLAVLTGPVWLVPYPHTPFLPLENALHLKKKILFNLHLQILSPDADRVRKSQNALFCIRVIHFPVKASWVSLHALFSKYALAVNVALPQCELFSSLAASRGKGQHGSMAAAREAWLLPVSPEKCECLSGVNWVPPPVAAPRPDPYQAHRLGSSDWSPCLLRGPSDSALSAKDFPL